MLLMMTKGVVSGRGLPACPPATLCDENYKGTTVSSGFTIATDIGDTLTAAYLDPITSKPASGTY